MNELSLRPYLEIQKAPFSLQLSLISEDSLVLEKAPFPFRIISDAAPFTRLIEARLMTGAGSEIRKVFLLVQKDSYSLSGDDLRTLNNRDIDSTWQKACAGAGCEERNGTALILLHQTAHQEGKEFPVPFQPLFFCKNQRLFFDPPCPGCGLPLRQCCDDDLLIKSGLQPYSKSLRRYLYCPSCAASAEGSEFYALALENMDPPGLLDRRDLIRNFGRLIDEGRNHPDHQFPCLTCAENQECYGRSNRCLSRIAPFAFYPFFMLVFEAMSLHALDFLALVSGASFEELEAGLAAGRESGRADCLRTVRQKHPGGRFTFFNREEGAFGEKYFAEVLYLKLSFLGEFLQAAFPELALDPRPGPGLSLDRMWVRLAGQSGMLPLFWSFSLGTPDMDILPPQGSAYSRIPPFSTIYSLGLAWFHILLVNQKQDKARVYQALEEVMSVPGSGDQQSSSPDYGPDPAKGSQPFSPENIFWHPEGGVIGESGRRCWQKCLDLGWSLIHAGCHAPSQWSSEEFRQQFETLREEVKMMLFQGDADQRKPGHEECHHEAHPECHPPENHPAVFPPEGPLHEDSLPEASPEESRSEPQQVTDPQEDRAIHDILLRIMDKWRAEANGKPGISPAFEETVVLSSQKSVAAKPQDVTIPAWEDHAPEAGEDAILETVILSPQRQDAPAPAQGIPVAQPPSVPEVSPFPKEPEPGREALKPEPESAPGLAPAPEPDNFLAETIILSPKPSSAGREVWDRNKKKNP